MTLTRRDFLRAAGLGAAGLALPALAPRAARAAGTDPVLVSIFLRGGADPLSLVPPAGDPVYYDLRPTIAVAEDQVADLDGFFGLHPSLAPLHPLYQSGALAVLYGTGSPDGTRSHFDAQDFMDYAAPGDKTVADGWLNRYLQEAGAGAPIEGVSLGTAKEKSLRGAAPTLAFPTISGFAYKGKYASQRRAAAEAMYAREADGLLGRAAGEAFASIDLVATVDTTTSVVYPSGRFAGALRDIAALIRADLGTRCYAASLGGWDFHDGQVSRLDPLAAEFAGALAAFYEDLGAEASRTLILVVTEFGRTAKENGSFGSDHGHGALTLALGAGVQGGRVRLAGDGWPGLGPSALYQGRDLAVTCDFRDVFAEALVRHMGFADLGPVFPGFEADEGRFLGYLV